jgi:transposase
MKKMDSKNTSKKEVKKEKYRQGLPIFNFHAGGVDVGDSYYDVAISDGLTGFTVRSFKTFTDDLKELVNWFVDEGVTTVAMESTGVYWLNLYLLLEEAGIEPYLVNAKHVKNVTGRKKDDTDAIWLQKLHSCGLLQKSFQPEGEMRVLRTYVRQRKNLISICSDSVRRMQKSLELMNIKIHIVISDLLGKTGLNIVSSIIEGERDPDKLSKLRDSRIKASEEEIKKSLKGIWKQEYIFMLKQAYDEYIFYQAQINSCEEKIIEQLLNQVASVREGDIGELDFKKKAQKE